MYPVDLLKVSLTSQDLEIVLRKARMATDGNFTIIRPACKSCTPPLVVCTPV